MKAVLACLLLSLISVNANGFDFFRELFGYGPGPAGCGRPGGGPFGLGEFPGAIAGRCSCGGRFTNPCQRVVGSLVVGCPNTNQFLQCTGSACSNQTCPAGQVWNRTLNACAECAQGMHVAANGQVCACNEGTTYNSTSRTCVACPTDSVKEADRCYCNVSKAFDYKTNACRDCPAGSTLRRFQECRCNNNTQFWSEDWACKDCPGEWLPRTARRPFRLPTSKCTCSGTNQIFDRKTVTCFECPTGTAPSYDKFACQCQNRFQSFKEDSKTCVCIKGYEADATGTGCVRSAITTTTVRTGGTP